MNDITMSATVGTSYDETVARVRELLADAGFGVLTEIDLAAMTAFSPAVAQVAAEARERLSGMMSALADHQEIPDAARA